MRAKAYWSILKTLYFASQCTPVCNGNALPHTSDSVSDVSLSSIHFKDQDILKILHSLNYNKFMLYLLMKKVTSNFWKIIAQFHWCQYVVRSLKELFSTQCQNFLKKIVFSGHTNLDFVHQTYVRASYYQLFMTCMLVLIKSYASSESKLLRYIKSI